MGWGLRAADREGKSESIERHLHLTIVKMYPLNNVMSDWTEIPSFFWKCSGCIQTSIQIECFVLFGTVSDPHEDDACSHVPPADRPGAARLHLTRQSPDLTHPLNLQSTLTPQAAPATPQSSLRTPLSNADGL